MSRMTRNHFAPAVALAALAAALIRPDTVSAQAGDRALLNQVPSVDFVAIGLPDSLIATGSDKIDGAIVLLGQISNLHTWDLRLGTGLLAQADKSAPIDGERALLGRWPVSQRQTMEDWAQRPSDRVAGSAAPAVRILSARRDIPGFTLESRGAVKLAVQSDETRYGTITTVDDGVTL